MSLVIYKPANDKVDYTFDWNDGYLQITPSQETISTSVWTVDPAPDSPVGAGQLFTSNDSKTTTEATVFLNGGTDGVVYRVINKITTSGGRTASRELTVRVGEGISG